MADQRPVQLKAGIVDAVKGVCTEMSEIAKTGFVYKAAHAATGDFTRNYAVATKVIRSTMNTAKDTSIEPHANRLALISTVTDSVAETAARISAKLEKHVTDRREAAAGQIAQCERQVAGHRGAVEAHVRALVPPMKAHHDAQVTAATAKAEALKAKLRALEEEFSAMHSTEEDRLKDIAAAKEERRRAFAENRPADVRAQDLLSLFD